jgi:DNA-binding NtrC family response regulator
MDEYLSQKKKRNLFLFKLKANFYKIIKIKKTLLGKMLLVDDEPYEKNLLEEALGQKNWQVEIEYFSNVEDALVYLKKTDDDIFLLISDMNMPKINGLDFKKTIDKDYDTKQKSVPFIFVSNADNPEQVTEAFLYRVQGYFKKPLTVDLQAEMFDIIIRYWIISNHPHKENVKKNNELIE